MDHSAALKSGAITELLQRASAGDQSAANDLMRSIEKDLRKIAACHLRRERPNHTLQITAIVNETYIRLLGAGDKHWDDRLHFFAVASRVMRHLLVDYARKRNTETVPLDLTNAAVGPAAAHILDVHHALEDFEKIAPRQAELVQLRFFGGLSLDDAAEVLKIAPRTADKDWALARAWLRKRLS